MLKLLLVGVGGFLGSISRYMLSGFVHNIIENPWLPYGTLVVNVVGCFIIGFLNGIAENREIFTTEIRLLIFTGFLGGFTTFSTMGHETFAYLRDGQIIASITNIFIHIILGLTAVWFGFFLSQL